jgi:hypothetical protein
VIRGIGGHLVVVAGALGPTQVIIAGHAFMQNLRRGHYELATDLPVAERVPAAFTELSKAI